MKNKKMHKVDKDADNADNFDSYIKDASSFELLPGVDIELEAYRYTNLFKVQTKSNKYKISLIPIDNLLSYGCFTTSYRSDNLVIKNQMSVRDSKSKHILTRVVELNAVVRKNMTYINSLIVMLHKIDDGNFVMSVERCFINSQKPFKQSVTFYWLIERASNIKQTAHNQYYTFNTDSDFILNDIDLNKFKFIINKINKPNETQ